MATAEKIETFYQSDPSYSLITKCMEEALAQQANDAISSASNRRTKKYAVTSLGSPMKEIDTLAQQTIGSTSSVGKGSSDASVQLSQLSQMIAQASDSMTNPEAQTLLTKAQNVVQQAQKLTDEPSDENRASFFAHCLDMFNWIIKVEVTAGNTYNQELTTTSSISDKAVEIQKAATAQENDKLNEASNESTNAQTEAAWQKGFSIALFVLVSLFTLGALGPIAFLFSVGLFVLSETGALDALCKAIGAKTPEMRLLVKLIFSLAVTGIGAGLSSAFDTALASSVESAASSSSTAAAGTEIEMTNFASAETAEATNAVESATASTVASTSTKLASATGSLKAAISTLGSQALLSSNLTSDLASSILDGMGVKEEDKHKYLTYITLALNIALCVGSMVAVNWGASQSSTGAILSDKLEIAAKGSKGWSAFNTFYKGIQNTKFMNAAISLVTLGSTGWGIAGACTDFEQADTARQKGPIEARMAQINCVIDIDNDLIKNDADCSKQTLKALKNCENQWMEISRLMAAAAQV